MNNNLKYIFNKKNKNIIHENLKMRIQQQNQYDMQNIPLIRIQ